MGIRVCSVTMKVCINSGVSRYVRMYSFKQMVHDRVNDDLYSNRTLEPLRIRQSLRIRCRLPSHRRHLG